jgi:RNA polymerase sigma-70 factor (ECF subfamily)
MSERALVRKILAGDQQAADRFVREHYSPVLRFLSLVTRSHEDAQDLAQQTFVKAKGSLLEFRFESKLRTWLFGIAYHEYTHWLRSSSHEVAGFVSEGTSELSEDAIVLAGAIGELPELHREAFVLREVDRLSVRETARVLGVPEGTVKSRCAEARAILVRKLGSTFGPSNHETCEADNGQ